MCDVTKCNRGPILGYSAFGPRSKKDVSICEYHWKKHCDDDDKFDIKTHFYPLRIEKNKK